MTDHNYSNDETIDVVISEVLKRMKLVKEPVISWQQLVYAHDGKITKPEIVSEANRLLDSILVNEYGSIDGYEKFLVKQQKMYEDYVKQVDKNQKQYVPSPVVKPSPTETTKPVRKTRKTPAIQETKPSSIADKIGAKRRGKTIEELAAEKNMDVSTYIWFYRNER